jgi:uncharacterized protein
VISAAETRAEQVVDALDGGADPGLLSLPDEDDRFVHVLDGSGSVLAASEDAPARPPAVPGAVAGYAAMAGPTAINSIPARSVLRVARYRPGRKARTIARPVLIQIADNDLSAPPSAARKAAFRCRADVRHYPCDHFDVYPGNQWFESVAKHQLHFLRRNFASQSPFAPVEPIVVTC